jgi:peroxiredoxin
MGYEGGYMTSEPVTPKPRRYLVLGLGLVLGLALFVGCAKAPTVGHQRLEAGDPAPEFVLSGLTGGEEVNSSRVFSSNAATVVVIWSMACPTCRDALKSCQDVFERYAAKSIGFYGINFDSENLQGVRAFIKAEGITFTNLWDPRFRAARAYRALDFTFSVFVADQASKLVLVQYDHPPDLASMISKALDTVLAKGMKQQP